MGILHKEQIFFYDIECLNQALAENSLIETRFQKRKKKLLKNPRLFPIDPNWLSCYANQEVTNIDVNIERKWFWPKKTFQNKFQLEEIENRIIKELKFYQTLKKLILDYDGSYIKNTSVNFIKYSPLIYAKGSRIQKVKFILNSLEVTNETNLEKVLKSNMTVEDMGWSDSIVLSCCQMPNLIITEDPTIKSYIKMINEYASRKYHTTDLELA